MKQPSRNELRLVFELALSATKTTAGADTVSRIWQSFEDGWAELDKEKQKEEAPPSDGAPE